MHPAHRSAIHCHKWSNPCDLSIWNAYHSTDLAVSCVVSRLQFPPIWMMILKWHMNKSSTDWSFQYSFHGFVSSSSFFSIFSTRSAPTVSSYGIIPYKWDSLPSLSNWKPFILSVCVFLYQSCSRTQFQPNPEILTWLKLGIFFVWMKNHVKFSANFLWIVFVSISVVYTVLRCVFNMQIDRVRAQSQLKCCWILYQIGLFLVEVCIFYFSISSFLSLRGWYALFPYALN